MLFVAEEAGRGPVDPDPRVEGTVEPGLLAELAARRLERRLAGFDLATDREPDSEPRVFDEEDLAGVAREDGDGEGAAIGHRASLAAAAPRVDGLFAPPRALAAR